MNTRPMAVLNVEVYRDEEGGVWFHPRVDMGGMSYAQEASRRLVPMLTEATA